MNIPAIQNNDSGAGIRSKLNALIADHNDFDLNPAIRVSGTLPGKPLTAPVEFTPTGGIDTALYTKNISMTIGSADDADIGGNATYGASSSYISDNASQRQYIQSFNALNSVFIEMKTSATDAGILVGGTAPIFEGLKYKLDYSANFGALSVPQVGYNDAKYVKKAGDTMTGTLILSADPINAMDAATKRYADNLVVGLLDDRGSHNASGNLFPGTNGSGPAGAILKGDLWYISVGGTLGGVPVSTGFSVRALVNGPGQTAANWDILSSGLGYIPENIANKATTFSTLNNTLYPTTQAVSTYVLGRGFLTSVPLTYNEIGVGNALNKMGSSQNFTYVESGPSVSVMQITSANNIGQVQIVADSAGGGVAFLTGGGTGLIGLNDGSGELYMQTGTTLGAAITTDGAFRLDQLPAAPAAPAECTMWFDGTDLKIFIGGTTKTFNLI